MEMKEKVARIWAEKKANPQVSIKALAKKHGIASSTLYTNRPSGRSKVKAYSEPATITLPSSRPTVPSGYSLIMVPTSILATMLSQVNNYE